MKLNLSQIQCIAHGAHKVWQEDDGFHLSRFTDEELKLYKTTPHAQKSLSTSGIKLCFKTNSPTLKLIVNTIPGTTRTYFAAEVFVNGERFGCIKNFEDELVLGKQYPPMQFKLGKYEGEFDLSQGEKVIEIVLPWSVNLIIESIELADNSTLQPIEKNIKLLAFGDSITHGYDALYPSNSYAERISKKLCAEIYNKAIGGEVFIPSLSALKVPFSPDIITVAYGTNDWNCCDRYVFQKNCSAFFENLAKNYPDTPIFAITPLWRKEHTDIRPMGEFSFIEEYITKACSKYNNITVIRGFDIIPHDETLFADFRLHPNDNGFDIYSEYLYKEISKTFRR